MSEIKIVQSFVVSKTPSIADFKSLQISKEVDREKILNEENRSSTELHLVCFPAIKNWVPSSEIKKFMEIAGVKTPSINMFLSFGEQHYSVVEERVYINSFIGFTDPEEVDIPSYLYLSSSNGKPAANVEPDNYLNTYGGNSLFLVEKV